MLIKLTLSASVGKSTPSRAATYSSLTQNIFLTGWGTDMKFTKTQEATIKLTLAHVEFLVRMGLMNPKDAAKIAEDFLVSIRADDDDDDDDDDDVTLTEDDYGVTFHHGGEE